MYSIQEWCHLVTTTTNRQTDREIYSSQKAQIHIKSVKIKWNKQVLGDHVPNPVIMSAGYNNNRLTVQQTDRLIEGKIHKLKLISKCYGPMYSIQE